MLNFEPNHWYVYIIHNRKTDWFYIGLHHQVSNSPYSNSSSSVMLDEAIQSGFTSDYIVWKGKNAEKAAALETYLINLAKANGCNLYNKNSGGGFKGGARPSVLAIEDCNVGENIILHKIFPKSIQTDDEVAVNMRLRKIADEIRDAVRDKHEGRSNPHQVVYEPIDMVLNMPFLQIRENAVDKKNVDRVIESMLLDMNKAEYLVEPVTVVKFPNGSMLRVDGTSTTYAIKEINQWRKVPVVYLNSEVFNDNETYMEVYATLRNRPEKHKGVNDPKKELKARIRNFHLSNQNLFEEDIETFQKKFSVLFSGSYSQHQISKNLSIYIKNVKEQKGRGENWIDYSVNEGKLIEQIGIKLRSMFPRCTKHTSVAIGSLQNTGVGNNLNYFGNTHATLADTAITIVTHTTHETEGKEEHYYELYKNSLEQAGFYPDPHKKLHGYTPFVSKITGKKIFVFFLPCRVNTRKRIDANYIVDLLMPEDRLAA